MIYNSTQGQFLFPGMRITLIYSENLVEGLNVVMLLVECSVACKTNGDSKTAIKRQNFIKHRFSTVRFFIFNIRKANYAPRVVAKFTS